MPTAAFPPCDCAKIHVPRIKPWVPTKADGQPVPSLVEGDGVLGLRENQVRGESEEREARASDIEDRHVSFERHERHDLLQRPRIPLEHAMDDALESIPRGFERPEHQPPSELTLLTLGQFRVGVVEGDRVWPCARMLSAIRGPRL